MKYQSLEAFRGLAAILVALFHSAFVVDKQYPIISQGAIFVDFFFVLSGFIITFAYSNKIKQGFKFIPFFILRFGRLYPLHILLLLVWLPYIIIKIIVFYNFGLGDTNPVEQNNIQSFLSNLLLINALNIHDHLSWNFPAWSISVELFTYIVFFITLSLFRNINELMVAITISFSAYLMLYINNEDTLLKTYDWGLIRCLGGFFLGSAVFHLSNVITFNFTPALANLLELGSTILMLTLVINSANNTNYQLASFLSFSLIIYIFSAQNKGIISQSLNIPPLVFLGTLSYSIYMTHAIVFAISATIGKKLLDIPSRTVGSGDEQATLLITPYADLINITLLAFIIGLSYLTYRFVEVPWRDKFRVIAGKFTNE